MNNWCLLNHLLSHYLVSNNKMGVYNVYICISIIYNFSTIDDLKDSVVVAAREQGVESGNYDKGYSKKSENRF